MAEKQSMSDKWLSGASQGFKSNFAWELGSRALLGGEGLNPETVASSAANAAAFTLLGPFGTSIMMAQPLMMVGQLMGTAYARAKSDWTRTTRLTTYDKDAAATMRQRAIQAIQGSKLNARSALGNEASLLHR